MAADDPKYLVGQAGDETLAGGIGNDTFSISADGGSDVISGDDGHDTIIFNGEETGNGVQVTLSDSGTGSYQFGTGSGEFTGVEAFAGTHNDDAFDASMSVDGVTISAEGGNDEVIGGMGADTLSGGDGDDNIDAGEGADSLSGGAGQDMLSGGDDDDTLSGGGGDDTLYGGNGDDHLSDTIGDNILSGGAGDDTVQGGQGADSITGDDGDDSLSGGSGNDTIDGGQGADSIEGGLGDDVLYGGSPTLGVNPAPASFAETSGTSGTVAGTSGNAANDYQVTSNTGTVAILDTPALDADGNTYQMTGYHVGDGSNANEIHTHTFDNQVGSVRLNLLGLDPDEHVAIQVNGVTVQINMLISAGLASFDPGSTNYTVASDGTIVGDSTDGAMEHPATLTVHMPLTSFGVQNISDSGLGNGSIYTLEVDSNPAWVLENDGADTIHGGAGADEIHAAGGDVVDGGEDTLNDHDTLYVTDVDHVSFDAANGENGTITFHDGTTLTFSNIETVMADGVAVAAASGPDGVVEGTSGDDMIDPLYTGDPDGEKIDAGDGPGGSNDDLVQAGAGNDTVVAGEGNDTVFGGTGGDSLYGENGDDSLSGDAGNDQLFGGAGADTLNGGAGDDTIHAGSGDVVDGGADTDTLMASDVYSVTFDAADPTSGTMTFTDNSTLHFANIESLTLNGGSLDGQVFGRDTGEVMGVGYVDNGGDMIDGNDQILAGLQPNDDEIFAMGGNDTVHAGEGADSVFGGDGNDALYGDAGNDSMQGDDGDDTLYGGLGDDYIRGDIGNDHDYGGVGNDTLYGGKGNDWIEGAEDNDSIFGGYGDDSVYGGVGNDTITGSGGDDKVYGGDGDDSLQGSNGADSIFGGAGADSIYGEEDADSIYAGSGDYVDGGETIWTGTDEFVHEDPFTNVDSDSLYVTDATAVHFDVLNPEQGTIDFADGGSLTFYDIENVFVDGQQVFAHAGVVEGTAGNDVIDASYNGDPEGDHIDAADDYAHDDNDMVRGFGGNDRIEAGAGNDTVFGGDGNDTILGGTGADTLWGEAGDDSLSGGDGTDVLYGGDGADTLDGGAGTNRLFGGAGNDLLHAGTGVETLDGGADNDVFVVEVGAGHGSHIDGGDGQDTLDLTDAGPVHVLYDDDTPGSGVVQFLDADGHVESSLTFSNIEHCIVPCFTPGTMILTNRGEIAVEDLEPGDRILTRDHGFQPLRWTARRALTAADTLAADGRFAPVRILRDAFGPGLPAQDLVVSPQHRMLLGGTRAEMLFGETEVLVPAIHLVGLPGIERAGPGAVTYIHLLFDTHQIIHADGCWSESYQPGARTLDGLENAQREEVLALFPELASGASFPAARVTLKSYETQVLLAG